MQICTSTLFVGALLGLHAIGLTPQAEAAALPEQLNDFGLRLYLEAAKQPGNLVFSPLSVSIATAMLEAGAEGGTRSEIASATGLDLPDAAQHAALADLLDDLRLRVRQMSEYSTANGIWIDARCKPKPELRDLLIRDYDAQVGRVDFARAPSQTADSINAFVRRGTENNLGDVVAPTDFDEFDRMVLVNVVYLLAAWDHRFAVDATKSDSFHLEEGGARTVQMMHRSMHARYYQDLAFQLIELPYQGDLAMVIALPRARHRLAEVEALLSRDVLDQWIGSMKDSQVEVALPRFEVKSHQDLVPLLRSLGIARAFDFERAEFAPLCGRGQLFLSLARHDAVLGVSEMGTKAAASTVFQMTAGIEMPSDSVVTFRADHPFLFFVRDTKSGLILFAGRLIDPGVAE
ncbi:MAG: serpin family protein [Candidatus Eisenbacteria bacterium]